MIEFIHYPKCSTCKRAQQFLEKNNIEYQERNIVEKNPTKEELKLWYQKSEKPLKKYFNTSGNVYKQLNLKEKLEQMTEEEQLELLGSNGMLIRRPLLITDEQILIGFKEAEWNQILKK